MPTAEASWVEEAQLENCEEMIEAFRRQSKQGQRNTEAPIPRRRLCCNKQRTQRCMVSQWTYSALSRLGSMAQDLHEIEPGKGLRRRLHKIGSRRARRMTGRTTRHNTTRSDTTRHEATRHEATRHDRTRQGGDSTRRHDA
jgi:hypothetical protein